MSEYQWGVQHYSPISHEPMYIAPSADEAEARSIAAACNEGDAPCRVLRREVSDWSPADSASGVVS